MTTTQRAPKPRRPLGKAGTEAWREHARHVTDTAALLIYCETLDERVILRSAVLRGETSDGGRRALRDIERRLDVLAEAIVRDRSWHAYAQEVTS
jgi:hypothetical protein